MGSFAERRTCSGHFRLCRPSGQGSAPYPRTRLSLQARRSRSELSGHNARGGAQGWSFGILRPVKDQLRLSLRLPSQPAWRRCPLCGIVPDSPSSSDQPRQTVSHYGGCSHCNPFAGPKGRSGVALKRLTGPAFVSPARGRERLFHTHRNTCRNLSAAAP